MLKTITRSAKQEREYQVLLGLIDQYLRTGKPVGSNTLKEAGFDNLSSATIRNYFAQLEEDGYLKQLHSSGGRIPTEKAYNVYAQEVVNHPTISARQEEELSELRKIETREMAAFVQKSAEKLSEMTNMAVFLSAPRFDQDFVLDVKIVSLDIHRCLCILITDFGVIRTEILHTEHKLSAFTLKRVESYFHWKIAGRDKPELDKEEEELAQRFYNEVMVRYIAGYSHFPDEEIYRTGFSRLLTYPDFDNSISLVNGLALFEHAHSIRLILRESMKLNRLKYWIGSALLPYSATEPNCTVITVPYHIGQSVVGAVGILGPMRLPYREFFGIMQMFSEAMSEALTKNIFKFKIQFRQPEADTFYLEKGKQILALEDKTQESDE